MKKNKKVVLITGGSRGIGKATALKFGKENYDVVITFKDSLNSAKKVVSEINSFGSKALAIKVDFNHQGDIVNLFKIFDQHFKYLNVLVNNAGWTKYIDFRQLDKIDTRLFDKIMQINLKAHFFTTKHAVKRMRKNSSIINISSIAAFNGIGSNIVYCAAKAGVVNMTKSLAIALGPKIRVASVAPGLTESSMTKSAPKSYLNEQIKKTPLGRIAKPKDIAKTIFALAEDLTFVNGKTIIVDGGRIAQ